MKHRLPLACVYAIATMITAFTLGAVPRAYPKRAGGPVLTFASDRVIASQASPGGTVYFASVSLYGKDFMIHVVKPAGTAVANGEGVAELLTAVHTRSVWLVVDGKKGGYTRARTIPRVARAAIATRATASC